MTTRLPIPKERLEQILAHCKRETPENMAPISAGSAVEIIGALLAAHEQEPVVNDEMALAFHHAIADGAIGSDELEDIKTGLRAAIEGYTRPAPSIPAAVPDEIPIVVTNGVRHGVVNGNPINPHRADGWNSCRAAMLNHSGDVTDKAEPVNHPSSNQVSADTVIGLEIKQQSNNDGWIPVSERLPDDDTYAVAADIAHGEIYSAFAAWFIHGRFSVMEGLSASNYDGGAIIEIDTPITHWMPLPASPQQEDK